MVCSCPKLQTSSPVALIGSLALAQMLLAMQRFANLFWLAQVVLHVLVTADKVLSEVWTGHIGVGASPNKPSCHSAHVGRSPCGSLSFGAKARCCRRSGGLCAEAYLDCGDCGRLGPEQAAGFFRTAFLWSCCCLAWPDERSALWPDERDSNSLASTWRSSSDLA